MITIGKKAKTVLKYISRINEGLIIKSDSLYTKFEDSLEVKSKGESNVIVEYKLPEGEIVLQEDFGIFNIIEFLNVIESFDQDTLKMEQEGNTIIIKDKRKRTTYYTNGLDSLPTQSPKGKELFDNGESKIVFALTEADIVDINKDLRMLNFDKLILKGDGGKLYITSDDSITSNNTQIDITSPIAKAEGVFEFPNTNIFNLLMPDSYKVVIKEATVGDNVIKICKFEAVSIEGLSYILVSA